MDRGTTISGVGHLGLILWVALGDWLFAPSDMPPMEVAEVSLVSEAEFDAMMAAAPSTPKPSKEPAVEPAKPEVSAPEPVQPDLPPAEPLPEPAQPEAAVEPAPQPELPPEVPVSADPQPVEAPPPVAPIAAEEQPIPVPTADKRPKPRPIDRVAPTPVDVTEDAPEVADTVTPEVTDQPAPDAPVVTEDQPAAAPEAATTQIITEAVDTEEDAPQLAPTSSRRPQSRPEKPAEQPVEETPTETATATDTQTETPPEDAPDPAADAIAAALAEAAAEPATDPADSGGQDAPQGPPMTSGERDALRVAVKQCWNVGSLSSEALRTTVTVRVDVGEDGKPDAASIRMTGYEGGSEAAASMMFEVARRAIIRCGKNGYPLPADKYDQWKDLELVFDPNGMRMR